MASLNNHQLTARLWRLWRGDNLGRMAARGPARSSQLSQDVIAIALLVSSIERMGTDRP